MTFEQYLEQVQERPTHKQLSAVKQDILRRLWSEGETFPRGWVTSSALLKITGQKYFDRRLRELRDEVGCDIETGHSAGEHAYRLVSANLSDGNLRQYLTASQKQGLFERANFSCAVCGVRFEDDADGLQADHKIPLVRGGDHAPTNWQTLCVSCNVGKRRACAGCQAACASCPWAFPEVVGVRVVIAVSPEVYARLQVLARQHGLRVDELASDLIKEATAGLSTAVGESQESK